MAVVWPPPRESFGKSVGSPLKTVDTAAAKISGFVRGGTGEHLLYGSVTEERQSTKPKPKPNVGLAIGLALSPKVLSRPGGDFVVPQSKIHKGYSIFVATRRRLVFDQTAVFTAFNGLLAEDSYTRGSEPGALDQILGAVSHHPPGASNGLLTAVATGP
jgi:hypothetical protein